MGSKNSDFASRAQDSGWRDLAAPESSWQPQPRHLTAGVATAVLLGGEDCACASSHGVRIWKEGEPFGGPLRPWPLELDPRMSSLTESYYAVPYPLESGAKYFRQVHARNAGGETAGPVWDFPTAGGSVPPPAEWQFHLENGNLAFTWQSDGEVWIESATGLGVGVEWITIGGPILNFKTWQTPLPEDAPTRFYRFRFGSSP